MDSNTQLEIAETLNTVRKMSRLEKFFGSTIILLAIACISWVAVKDHVDDAQSKGIEKLEVITTEHEKILNSKMPITDYQVIQITEAVEKLGAQMVRNDSISKKEIRHLQYTVVDIFNMTSAMYEHKTGKKYKKRWDE